MTRTRKEESTGIKSRKNDRHSASVFVSNIKVKDNEMGRAKSQQQEQKKFRLPIKQADRSSRSCRKNSPSATPTIRGIYSMSPNPCSRRFNPSATDQYGLSPAPERPPSGRKTAGMHFPASGVRNIKDCLTGSFFGGRTGRNSCTQRNASRTLSPMSTEMESGRGIAAHVTNDLSRDQFRRFSDVENGQHLYQEGLTTSTERHSASAPGVGRKCRTPDVMPTVDSNFGFSTERCEATESVTPVASSHRWARLQDPTYVHKRCQYLEAEVEYLRDREAELRERLCQSQSENKALNLELSKTQESWKEALAAKRKAQEVFDDQTHTITRLRAAYSEKLEMVRDLQAQLEEGRQQWLESLKKLHNELEAKEKKENRKNANFTDTDSDISLNEFFESCSQPSFSNPQERTSSSSCNNSPCSSPRTLDDIRSENKRLMEENKRLKADFEQIQQTQQVFHRKQRLDILKQDGNKHFERGNYVEALKCYMEAINHAQDDARMQAVLHSNKAATLISMDRYLDAIVSSCCAISLDSSYLRAYQRRSSAYEAIGDYSAAIQDLQLIISCGCTTSSVCREARSKLADLQRRHKRSHTADPYKVLGVATSATTAEVKSQFRKLALQFHPDKLSNQQGGAEVFKLISQANSILSDESKRRRFDSLHVDIISARFDQKKRF